MSLCLCLRGRRAPAGYTCCALLLVWIAGAGAPCARGVGLSRTGPSSVTLERGHPSALETSFLGSFWPCDDDIFYYPWAELTVTAPGMFYSFDVVQEVTDIFEEPVAGHSQDCTGALGFPYTTFLRAGASAAAPSTTTARFMYTLGILDTSGSGGIYFIPGVILDTAVEVLERPIAQPQTVAATEDIPVQIHLKARGQTGQPVTYSVVRGPDHGILTGSGPDYLYTARNYGGPDSFSFTANLGHLDSLPADVSIEVTPVNTPPLALPLPDQMLCPEETLDIDLRSHAVCGLLMEHYEGPTGPWWLYFQAMPGFEHYPDDPSSVTLLTGTFSVPVDLARPGGLLRLRGWLVAPLTGWYRFWVLGGGAYYTDLYLSPTADPAAKERIYPCWPAPGEPVWLEAGGRYYMECLTVHPNGDYSLEVSWSPPGREPGEPIPAANFVAGPAVSDSDLPADALAFELVAGPEGMTLDPASGRLEWAPTSAQAQAGDHLVTVRVTDGGTPPRSATLDFHVRSCSCPRAVGLERLTYSGAVKVAWKCLAGSAFLVEWTEDLLTGQWHHLAEVNAVASRVDVVDDAPGVRQRFYRLAPRP